MFDAERAPARKYIAAGVTIAVVSFAIARLAPREKNDVSALRSTIGQARIDAVPGQAPLAELTSLVEAALKSSRPLLLGSRDPNGPSCVDVARSGDIQDVAPESKGDLDGGPGTSMAVLYYFDRQEIKSPLEDFTWHQTRLRTYLENNIVLNATAEQIVHEATQCSRRWMEEAETWSDLPSDAVATGFRQEDDWPSYCLTALNTAVAEKDLAAVKRWSREVAAAAFWLEDLIRWRGLLFKNHLAALDFQAKCESLFKSAEQSQSAYFPITTLSQYPAGVLGLNGRGNYYEVERQAERLYSMPADRFVEILDNKNLTGSSVRMPPASRAAFLKLRAVLSPDNQKTWDLAAQTPYEHSYLVNMLFRARTVELVDDLATSLKNLDARRPRATIGELMGVLMYRGHSFAGLEWGDRFSRELIESAAEIPADATDQEALQQAKAWTYDFYKSPTTYGITLTLRDALENKKLDCVRATDMIAAIFRNAGRTRLGHVRWSCESGGHSVAAYLAPEGKHVKPLLVDGMTSARPVETWPDCYFQGHEWPLGFEENRPPYAVELYWRGIDSYVWAQGYIVRGPNAGLLISTPVPYSSHFGKESAEKVYEGSYPD